MSLISPKESGWHGVCDLRLINRSISSKLGEPFTSYQARCNAPFKIMRGSNNSDGRFEIPILHTAGGLVGGDQLEVNVIADIGTSGLLTTVAAQKVYGTVGLSLIHPQGRWAKQLCDFDISKKADLEWFPQELVIFANGLFEQNMHVDLYPDSSFLTAEVVRLGRTADGEKLGAGSWRSRIEICRHIDDKKKWEFVDQLELSGEALSSDHGLADQPVFGSLVWIAPTMITSEDLHELADQSRELKIDLEGTMACSALDHGLSARYIGSSSQAARLWFYRIWGNIRKLRNLTSPTKLRFWPIQENLITETMCNKN